MACLNSSAAVDLGNVEVCTELKPSFSWTLASAGLYLTAVRMQLSHNSA